MKRTTRTVRTTTTHTSVHTHTHTQHFNPDTMGCASSSEAANTPLSDLNAAKEVADLKSQVHQLKRQLASVGQAATPEVSAAEPLFIPDRHDSHRMIVWCRRNVTSSKRELG